MKRSSSTHCVKGSQTTGQASVMPKRSATWARSSSVVTGVIRSTIELGKATCSATQSARPASPEASPFNRAYAVKTSAAMWPLPWMLSQDMIVNGTTPRSRRRSSASVTRPKTVCGAAPGCRSATTLGFVASNFPVTGEKL